MLCPKRMLNGPCGGVRGELCEVGDFECPFVKALRAYKDPPLILDPYFKVKRSFEPRTPFSDFMKKLTEGWVISTEYEPWERKIIIADAVNVTDNPFGIPHSHGVYESIKLRKNGVEVIAQLVCRNKGREVLASEALALARGGVKNVLALTGDWSVNSFFDLDSTRLVYILRLMGEGLLWDGTPTERTLLHVGVAVNPYMDINLEEKRLKRKIKAGAEFAQSQPVFDSDALRRLSKLNKLIPIQGGILLTSSKKVVKMLEEKGVKVDQDFIRALKEAKRDNWEPMIDFTLRLAKSMREFLNGIHLMCPNAKEVCERLIGELRSL